MTPESFIKRNCAQSPVVLLPVGLPASGKSAWARAELRRRLLTEGTAVRLVRLSRDDLRQVLTVDYGSPVREFEDLVSELHEVMLPALLRRGVDVIMDETSLNPDHLIPLLGLIERHGARWQMIDFTRVGVDTCIRRDRQRGAGGVGEDVIRVLAEQLPAARYMVGAFGTGPLSAAGQLARQAGSALGQPVGPGSSVRLVGCDVDADDRETEFWVRFGALPD